MCVQLEEDELEFPLKSVTFQLTGHQVLLQSVAQLLALSCLRETNEYSNPKYGQGFDGRTVTTGVVKMKEKDSETGVH